MTNFTDVTTGGWYKDAVNLVYEKNVISGYGNGASGPGGSISREKLCRIQRDGYLRYGRSQYIHKYGRDQQLGTDAMKWVVDCKLISGTSGTTFYPLGTATRVQSAVILMNCLVNIAA